MDEGDAVAGIRMQEESAPAVIAEGAHLPGFTPGYRFDLKGHYRRDLNGKSTCSPPSLIIPTREQLSNSRTAGAEQDYLNRFRVSHIPPVSS
jgi:uncharacterized protein involved in type VI secretion and phage assembly